jgi:hypothetical protein
MQQKQGNVCFVYFCTLIKIKTMTVLLTLTTGIDSGPFDLYSSSDAYTVPFEQIFLKLY